MKTLNAHFDGKVIVPDEPLNLPANQKLRVQVEPIESPQRRTHFRAHRTLTPKAAAAAVTVQPSTTTLRVSSRRPLQLRAALACRSIRVASLELSCLRQRSASKAARMNQRA